MARLVFHPLGGVPQLHVDGAATLQRIHEVDAARWAATSVPLDQLFCDPALRRTLDRDGNGRLRVQELLEARDWLFARLSGHAGIDAASDTLTLTDLAPDHADAHHLGALARRLLRELGTPDAPTLSLAQLRALGGGYARSFPNGDGVVAPTQIDDPALAAWAEVVLAHTDGAPDLGGEPGVRAVDVTTWVARCTALRAWREAGADPALRPVGDDTPLLAAATTRLGPKMAQFFAQGALLHLDPLADARLQATAEDLASLDVRDPAAITAWLDAAPLAPAQRDGVLRMDGPINPSFRDEVALLSTRVAPAALGVDGPVDRLDATGWARVMALFAPYRAWRATRPEGIAEDTDDATLDAALHSPHPAALLALCEADQRVAADLQAYQDLERLLLTQRWLLELTRNMVSFQDLFDPEARSLLEMGTLVLDGRRLRLCMRVDDVAAHKAMATGSGMFIVYCALTRRDAADLAQDVHATVACAVTSGERGGIDKGKRGVFYDRQGEEWDALIVDLIVQPISLWESAWAPIHHLRASIADRVRAMAETSATRMEDTARVAQGGLPLAAPAAAPAAATGLGGLQGLVLGGSVAFAALGSAFAFVVQTLASIRPLDLAATLGLVLGLLLGAGTLRGYVQLVHRDLSTLLEANGWALNGRMRMTFRLGSAFTTQPSLPPASLVRWTPEQRRTLAAVVALTAAIAVLAWLAWRFPDALPKGE